MKYVTTKYGTKINVEGLNPKQVKQVMSTAQDNGAYGAKGAALADTFRKKNKTGPTQPGQPGDTKTTPGAVDLTGAPDLVGAEDLSGDVNAARDAAYGYITKDYASQKANDVEAKKQELANRGIPYDPNPDSLWGRSMKELDNRYQSMDDQAKNQAIASGNAILGTESQVSTNAYDAFIKALGIKSTADLTKYGIDKDFVAKMKQIAATKQIEANKLNKPSGGGGSSDVIVGGNAPGFDL